MTANQNEASVTAGVSEVTWASANKGKLYLFIFICSIINALKLLCLDPENTKLSELNQLDNINSVGAPVNEEAAAGAVIEDGSLPI